MGRGRDGALTRGNPLRVILRFALPIYIGQVFQLAYGLADTRIIGSVLGESSLAAVGATAALSDLLIEFLNGVVCGFGIVIASCAGAKAPERVRRAIGGTVTLSALTTALLSGLCLLFLPQIIGALNVSEALMQEATAYIGIIIAGLIATTAFNACAAVLRSVGDSFTPLLFLIASNLLNIGMDWLAVRHLNMGVRGAALATVIAQGISALCCFLYMRRVHPEIRISPAELRLDRETAGQLLPQGMSMGFMISFVTLGSLALQTGINHLGADVIVAHTAARKLTMLFLIPFFVLGTALSTFCGQNLGAKMYARIGRGIRDAALASLVWCAAVLVAVFTLAPNMVHLITASGEVEIVRTATRYLRVNSAFYFLPALICILRNSMQGLGDTRTPLISSFIELAGKAAIACFLVPAVGYMGVIVSEPIVWTVMIVPLLFGMRRIRLRMGQMG